MDQLDRIRALGILDVDRGLSYCGDSREFYLEMLRAFVENSRLKGLLDAFNGEDLQSFRVDIHALKSGALTIGAVEFSQQCRLLEHAAKNWDINYIEAHTLEVLDQYQSLMAAIWKAVSPAVPESADYIHPASRQNRRNDAEILIVDDDEINRRSAESILKETGTICTVTSGEEALSYLKTASPKLILLDLHMPDMNGFQVMEAFQKDPVIREIPVVFLTPYPDPPSRLEDVKQALTAAGLRIDAVHEKEDWRSIRASLG